MNAKITYFVVSDIHGHYSELMDVLKTHNFDWHNDSHVLVVAGDWTDRGPDSAKLFKLFTSHTRRKIIVLRGNHDEILEDYMETFDSSRNRRNGIIETINSFRRDEDYMACATKWMGKCPDYLETKTHIITHGSLQTTGDWKNPIKGWSHHHWNDGTFYLTPVDTDKKIVVGHYAAGALRIRYCGAKSRIDDILISEDGQRIFIDGHICSGGKINVYIFEE